MKKIYHEFKQSLKDTAVEEIVDLFIFRPISFALVKLIYRFPITPNQISVMAIFAGIAAGVFLSFGSHRGFVYGGILYSLSHILDCCDGMIARLKKNGTPIGRIIDGWADYITSIAVYAGLLMGLTRGVFDLPVSSPWMLMLPAGFFLALHAMKVDFYRNEFLAHALGKSNSIQGELDLFTTELEKYKQQKGKKLEILLVSVYLKYTKMQLTRETETRSYPGDSYYTHNRTLLMMWNLIGLSTHIFALVLSVLLYEPMIFFYYVIGFANVWMLFMEVLQRFRNKKLSQCVAAVKS